MMTKELIGGEYYTLKKNNKKLSIIMNDGIFFNTGRASLYYLINKIKDYDKIYVPSYSCGSFKSVIIDKKKIIYYDIDKNFFPILKKKIKNSIIIVIDYFGKKTNFKNYTDNHIIHDISHSWMNYNKINNKKNYFYFASLRKFGIYNLGGWCNSIPLNKSILISKNNLGEDLYRLRNEKYNFIKKNKLAENITKQNYFINQFNKMETKIIKNKMIISKSNISSITNLSFSQIIKIRKKNYNYLKNKINLKNIIKLNLKANDVPVFFLIKFLNEHTRDKIRIFLKTNNIFCPIHWRTRYTKFYNSNELSKKILSIPIDQRYNITDMYYILSILKKYDKSLLKI